MSSWPSTPPLALSLDLLLLDWAKFTVKITKQRLVEIIKEELASVTEVHSEKQRNYMCAMADEDADRPKGLSQAEAAEMCSGPMKEDYEGDADEAFIQSSQLGQADAQADEAADRNSEEDEGYQANRKDADSDKDYVRAYEAERRKDALVLKGPKVDPLGDSLAARRLRAIARRKAGDKR